MTAFNTKGFTLIELLTVLLILSIVLHITGFGFDYLIQRARLNKTLRQLVTDIRYAQQMAIGEGRSYYIVFDRYSELYRIQVPDNPVPKILKQIQLDEGVQILGTNFPEDRFCFTPLGAPSRGGTITIIDGRGNTYEIRVLPATGRVKVYY